MSRMFIILVSLSLVLTGCWDQIEVEERGFVIGVAVDLEEEEDNTIELTQQFVVPSNLQTSTSGSSSSSSQQAGGNATAYMNESHTGESPMEIVRLTAARTSRTPFFAHVKGIVLSEDLARKRNINDYLDFFIRDLEMRRGTYVYIAKGKAKEIIDVVPKNEKIPFLYIQSIQENTYKNVAIYPKKYIGEVQELQLQRRSFGLPMLEKGDGHVEINNTAVISGQTNQMVGVLDREETMGLNFIQNKVKGGFIKIKIDDKPILFDIFRMKTNLKADIKDNDQITFKISIDTEGGVSESFPPLDFTKQETLNKVQEEVVKVVKDRIFKVVEKTQDLNADVLGFGEYLRQNHYDNWLKIKDDWEKGNNYFSQVSVDVDVDASIRIIGSDNKSGPDL